MNDHVENEELSENDENPEGEKDKEAIFTKKKTKKRNLDPFIRVRFRDRTAEQNISASPAAESSQEALLEVTVREKQKPSEKKKQAKGPTTLFGVTGLGEPEVSQASRVMVSRDTETGFPASFIREVKNIFKQDAWNLTFEKNHIQATEKVDANPKQIDILRNESNNEVKFSARNGPTDELIQSLKAYETAMAPEMELEYEVSASSEEEAKAYVKKMHDQKINTGNIFSIRIGTTILDKEADIQAFVEEALKQPSKTAKLK